MTTEIIDFEPLNSVNAVLLKYLEGLKTSSTPDLSPRQKKILQKARGAYENGNYNTAITFYKIYIHESIECQQKNNNTGHLDIVVQYMIAKCLLYSDQFEDLVEARKVLNDLESYVGDKYPMICYALAEFYIKVFCFNEADRYIKKCFAILSRSGPHGSFPMCFIPESSIYIPESTLGDLRAKLLNVQEQCSGWHPPDAKCFMNNCTTISPNHISGRNIFIKSPAFNGMVTVICSNIWNPCTIVFHSACWKVKKDETSSPLKISDKEILLNWPCFTPNCGTDQQPSLIKTLTIHKEDGTIKSIEPIAEKSNWHIHQPNLTSKGAIRKQKHENKMKSTPKMTKSKAIPSTEKDNDKCPSLDVYSNGNDSHNRSGSDHECPDLNPIQEKEKGAEPEMLCNPFTMKVLKMVGLRSLNFHINIDDDWRPNKAYYGNEHMKNTITKGYEPDFSSDCEQVACLKSFLFSYFLTYIEHNGPIKDEQLMREWNNVTGTDDFSLLADEFSTVFDIREFLLQSFMFLAIEDYICIPALLPGVYALVEENACSKVTEMLEKNFQSTAKVVKIKKKDVSEKLEEKLINQEKSADSHEKSEPLDNDDYKFLLSPNDFMDSEEETESELESESESESEDNATQEDETNIEETIDNDRDETANTDEQMNSITDQREAINQQVESPNLIHSPDNLKQDLAGTTDGCALGSYLDDPLNEQGIPSLNDNTNEETEFVFENEPEITVREEGVKHNTPECEGNYLEGLVVRSLRKSDSDEEHASKKKNGIKSQATHGKEDQRSHNSIKSTGHYSTLGGERNIIESESEESLTGQGLPPDDDKNVSKITENGRGCSQCTTCRCNEIADLKNQIKILQDNEIKSEDRIRNLKTKLEGKEKYFKDKLLETMKEALDYQYHDNETLISSKMELIQCQYDIVCKIQKMVYGVTKTFIDVDQKEWAEPLEKLERMRSTIRQEYKKLRGFILLEKNAENNPNELSIRLNTLKVLHFPQRNLLDLIETAFNMVINYCQQSSVVSYQPPSLAHIPTPVPPVMSLWYQQPQYPHPRSMMPTMNQIPSPESYQRLVPGQSPPVFMNPVVSRQLYDSPDWSSAVGPPVYVYSPKDMCDSPPGFDQKPSSTGQFASRYFSPPGTTRFKENHSEKTDLDQWLPHATSQESQKITKAELPSYPLATDTKVAQNTVEANEVLQEMQVEEDDKASSQSSLPKRKKLLLVDGKMKLRKPFTKVQVEIAAKPKDLSIISNTAISSNVAPPASTDEIAGASGDLPEEEQAIKTISPVASPISNEDPCSPRQSEGTKSPIITVEKPQENANVGENEKKASQWDRCQKRKLKSIDKLMGILRARHPYVLEYDLLWSVQMVRSKHNHSLSGLAFTQIIEEADNLIKMRQKLQIISYHARTSRTYHSENQRSPSNSQCEQLSNEARYSTAGSSLSQREYSTEANPWRKPQDLTWKKEVPEADCVICWETLQTNSKQSIYTLTCQHTFHKKCITNWFQQNRTCPTCRVHTTLEDEFPPLP